MIRQQENWPRCFWRFLLSNLFPEHTHSLLIITQYIVWRRELAENGQMLATCVCEGNPRWPANDLSYVLDIRVPDFLASWRNTHFCQIRFKFALASTFSPDRIVHTNTVRQFIYRHNGTPRGFCLFIKFYSISSQ